MNVTPAPADGVRGGGAMSCSRLRRMAIVTVFGHPHRLVTRMRAINVGADIN
ncbi:hypothetical protein [Burkholderia ubonensis]|uniref:hypothetical protein n=1 Tax=Burkholderia ubonensis TaxID=101571 RepID=UPI002AB15852|nr:hypothetical protein [Burkholderia ubonensis]